MAEHVPEQNEKIERISADLERVKDEMSRLRELRHEDAGTMQGLLLHKQQVEMILQSQNKAMDVLQQTADKIVSAISGDIGKPGTGLNALVAETMKEMKGSKYWFRAVALALIGAAAFWVFTFFRR